MTNFENFFLRIFFLIHFKSRKFKFSCHVMACLMWSLKEKSSFNFITLVHVLGWVLTLIYLHFKKKDLRLPSLGWTPMSYLAMSGCRSYEMLLKIRPRSTKESVNQFAARMWQWGWRTRILDMERSEFKT